MVSKGALQDKVAELAAELEVPGVSAGVLLDGQEETSFAGVTQQAKIPGQRRIVGGDLVAQNVRLATAREVGIDLDTRHHCQAESRARLLRGGDTLRRVMVNQRDQV